MPTMKPLIFVCLREVTKIEEKQSLNSNSAICGGDVQTGVYGVRTQLGFHNPNHLPCPTLGKHNVCVCNAVQRAQGKVYIFELLVSEHPCLMSGHLSTQELMSASIFGLLSRQVFSRTSCVQTAILMFGHLSTQELMSTSMSKLLSKQVFSRTSNIYTNVRTSLQLKSGCSLTCSDNRGDSNSLELTM